MDCLRLTIQAVTIKIRTIKTALHITKMKEHNQEGYQERRRKKSPQQHHTLQNQVHKNKNSTQVNFYSEMMQQQVKMVVVAFIIDISTLCVYVHSMCGGKSTMEYL